MVKYNLERLQEKDYLERSQEVSRGLRLKDGPNFGRTVEVHKFGNIAAGQPLAAFGQQDNPYAGETLTLTADLVGDPTDVYTLQVRGDSMIDALVNDGDWVVIRHQTTAQPHEMIVAWIRDREETTLKYYYPEGGRVRLQPANPKYEPIYVAADQLDIQGKVIAVVRQLP